MRNQRHICGTNHPGLLHAQNARAEAHCLGKLGLTPLGRQMSLLVPSAASRGMPQSTFTQLKKLSYVFLSIYLGLP